MQIKLLKRTAEAIGEAYFLPVARLNYQPPSLGEQALIWRILADASKIELSEEVITQIVVKEPWHYRAGR